VNDILSVQGGRYIGSNPQRLKVLTIGTGGTVATFGPTFGDIDYTVVPAQPALLTGGTCTTPPTLGSASGLGMSIATTQITAGGSGYTTAPSVTFGSGYVTATGTAILNTSMSISAGTGAINLTSGGVALTGGVSADTLRVTPGTPADNATCTAGQVGVDANYVYACTAANTWKRAALSTY